MFWGKQGCSPAGRPELKGWKDERQSVNHFVNEGNLNGDALIESIGTRDRIENQFIKQRAGRNNDE